MKFRQKGQKGQYDFLDAACIERECWAPGEYFTRGAAGGSGSRNTGRSNLCCMRRAYHGCPTERPELVQLGVARKAEGWKRV